MRLDGHLRFARIRTAQRERLRCVAAEVPLVEQLLVVLGQLHRHALLLVFSAGGDHRGRTGDGEAELGATIRGTVALRLGLLWLFLCVGGFLESR